jgi:hypothetical protein
VANNMEGLSVADRASFPDLGDTVVHHRSIQPDQRPVRAGVSIQLPGNDFSA